MNEHTWNNEYYDILEFFFWEPQHLGKIKNTKNPKSLNTVLTHLEKMEVTLNHQLNFFFQLLPSTLFQLFFQKINSKIKPDTYSFLSDKQLNIKDATQPDLFFDGTNNTIAIELKINAKCSLDQLMKYAILFHFNQLKNKRIKNNHLILIGKGSLENLFKEKFSSIGEIRKKLQKDLIPNYTKKGGVDLTKIKEQIVLSAQSMHISFINYQELFILLDYIKQKTDSKSPYSDTVFKLINGLQIELLNRNLA